MHTLTCQLSKAQLPSATSPVENNMHTLTSQLSKAQLPSATRSQEDTTTEYYRITVGNMFSALSPEKESEKHEVTWFGGHSHELSNWYTHSKCKGKCTIIVKNQHYPTTEHAYISLKGKYFNTSDIILNKIKHENDPQKVYYIGKDMDSTSFGKKTVELMIMGECLIAKYKGCDGYRQYLQTHANSV